MTPRQLAARGESELATNSSPGDLPRPARARSGHRRLYPAGSPTTYLFDSRLMDSHLDVVMPAAVAAAPILSAITEQGHPWARSGALSLLESMLEYYPFAGYNRADTVDCSAVPWCCAVANAFLGRREALVEVDSQSKFFRSPPMRRGSRGPPSRRPSFDRQRDSRLRVGVGPAASSCEEALGRCRTGKALERMLVVPASAGREMKVHDIAVAIGEDPTFSWVVEITMLGDGSRVIAMPGRESA